MHDWWIGLVASFFGKIAYLDQSTIEYRQHNSNDTGAKKYSYKNILKKTYSFIFNDDLYQKHLQKNILQAKLFLDTYEDELDDDIKNMLNNFIDIKSKNFFEKRKVLLKYSLLKYGIIRNLGLLLRI